MKKLLVISAAPSDLSKLLSGVFDAALHTPEEAGLISFDPYDALCVLGGTNKTPLVLPIDARLSVEAFHKAGKPVFAEYCASLFGVYAKPPVSDTADRLIWVGPENDALHPGDLLDDHANSFIAPSLAPAGAKPLLINGGHVIEHDRIDPPEIAPAYETWALWELDAHTLLCSLRMCNFLRSRLAPAARWASAVRGIAAFLGSDIPLVVPEPPVTLHRAVRPLREVFSEGMRWLDGVFLDEGRSGVLEGMSHNIFPDGTQQIAEGVRNDCAGEIAGTCCFDWLLNKNVRSLQRYENLSSFTLDKMVIHGGLLDGMMRWTTTGWDDCYQDDAARCLIGHLLYWKFTGDRRNLRKAETTLDFLVRTTGTDGLRVAVTENRLLTEEAIAELAGQPSGFCCAHFNAYYLASLLLAWQADGRAEYLETARRGLASLMAAFPDTIREHSETQELARLVLPLAILTEIERDEGLADGQGRRWLYEVTDRLEQHRHPSGAYLEYDTGYKANRSRTSGTESSLLANNGDPVADLLYTVNWLPLGFACAWRATGDEAFHRRWRTVCDFLSAAQIRSDCSLTNGAWARGVDVERMEIWGMPHDIGWGPACIESGWTVAEILTGIGLGLATESGLV